VPQWYEAGKVYISGEGAIPFGEIFQQFFVLTMYQFYQNFCSSHGNPCLCRRCDVEAGMWVLCEQMVCIRAFRGQALMHSLDDLKLAAVLMCNI